MDIGGNQERVASLIRHSADTADEIADGADCIPAVAGAGGILLTANPGVVPFFLGFLLQGEAGLVRAAGLLLLLLLILLLLLRRVDRSDYGRPIFGEENVD